MFDSVTVDIVIGICFLDSRIEPSKNSAVDPGRDFEARQIGGT